MLALRALGIAGQAALLAQQREVLPTRDELMHVRLVPRVPHDGVARRLEDSVDSERELDDPEVRAEVTARLRNLRHEESADLFSELDHL